MSTYYTKHNQQPYNLLPLYTSGIPQESVLQPVLFVIFINSIPEEIQNHIQMFADDTKLYTAVSNEEAGRVLQSDMKLEEWSHKWQIHFKHLGAK